MKNNLHLKILKKKEKDPVKKNKQDETVNIIVKEKKDNEKEIESSSGNEADYLKTKKQNNLDVDPINNENQGNKSRRLSVSNLLQIK